MKKKFVILIVIAIWIFQIIPLSVASTDGYAEAAQNSDAVSHAGDFHHDPVIVGRDNYKPELNVSYSKLSGPFQLQTFDPYISIQNFHRKFIVFDVRQETKKSLSGHFYQSKYRMAPFLI